MNRRWVAVCTAVVLSTLALPDIGEALTTRKSAARRTPASAVSRTRAKARSRTRGTAVARRSSCTRCSNAVARKKRGVKTAKRLPCHSENYVDPKIARNYRAALRDMKRAGIKPRITSVWRSSGHQAQLHRCSLSTRCRRAHPGLYGALPAGRSLHEAGFAVDIAGIAAGPRGRKRLTPRGRRIIAIMRKNGFSWPYGLSDPAHFEADPRKYGYRSARHAIRKSQTTCQVQLASNRTRRRPARKVALSRRTAPARSHVSTNAIKSRRRARQG
jgi:D-alanyl-D-alanine carboxypeptidase